MFAALGVPRALGVPQALATSTASNGHTVRSMVSPLVVPNVNKISQIMLALSKKPSENATKLRIAVVFAGRATCYEQTYEWYSKLSEKYDVDFYCSISTELNEYYQGLLDAFSVKKYKFETSSQITIPDAPIHEQTPRLMFYNWREAVDLVPRDEYDVILYARTDMVCTDDIDLSVAKGLDNTVFIPSGSDWGGTNDQMAFGTPEAMFKYSRLYDCIDDCISQGVFKTTPYLHPETTLSAYLRHSGMDVQRFELAYHLHPDRKCL